MNDANSAAKSCQLIHFEKAVIHLNEQLPITPNPPILVVQGVVNSLGVKVDLHFNGTEVFGADAWLTYQVVACGFWAAIGSINYTASAALSHTDGTKGVKVSGADGQVQEITWAEAQKFF